MKKSIQFFIVSMLLSPFANAQVKDFVIEPPIKKKKLTYL